jgi:predicted nicotinamide N-methyase
MVSVSLLLVPLAMAGVAAVQAAAGRSADGRTVQVQTRMRDVTLLAAALRDMGASVSTNGDALTATLSEATATFTRGADGIWAAHVEGLDQPRAVDLVLAVDAAYGRQVQQAVLTRLREQAPAAGLRLESESENEDASVRLVFEVGQERR